MPNEKIWQSFFDSEFILEELGLNRDCQAVVDFGCGYGTFSIPAARRIIGTVYGLDIEPEMINACKTKVKETGLRNVICQQRDFISDGSGLPDNSADYVMLFNILHTENPLELLGEADRILVPGGRIGVIHWNYDSTTPRGPSMDIRPRPQECQEWIKLAGFELVKPHINFPPYHYGIVGQKSKS